MKKFLLFFIIVILFFSSACVRNQDKRTPITFSTWGSRSEILTIKNLVAEFEVQNPNIKINLVHIPDNYFQKLHLLFASKLAPDVVFLNNLNSRIYMTAGKLEPLNEYLLHSKVLKKDDFFQKSFLPLSYQNQVFAIPRDVSNLVVYYNKTLFDKYSVPYPSADWTTSDFLRVSKKLTIDTNGDNKTEIWGMGFEKNSLFWLPFLFSDNGGIISPDEKKIIINNTSSLKALQFYADLRNKYKVMPSAGEQASLTTSQLFLQGKLAMHLCGRWCSMTYNKNADFNWDVVQFPAGKNGSVVGLDASGWAISSDSLNKDLAWKFIEFMASEKSMEYLAKDGLIFPANKNAALKMPVFSSSNDPFFNALNSSQNTPLSNKYSEINDILNEKLESLFDGNVSVQDVVDENLVKKLSGKL